VLASGETINSFTVAMSAEGTAVGLSIDNTTNPPAKIDNNTNIQIWFQVDPGEQSNVAFDGDGTRFAVTVSITTSVGRKYQKTWTLLVQQQ
jgi:hypothetical protein